MTWGPWAVWGAGVLALAMLAGCSAGADVEDPGVDAGAAAPDAETDGGPVGSNDAGAADAGPGVCAAAMAEAMDRVRFWYQGPRSEGAGPAFVGTAARVEHGADARCGAGAWPDGETSVDRWCVQLTGPDGEAATLFVDAPPSQAPLVAGDGVQVEVQVNGNESGLNWQQVVLRDPDGRLLLWGVESRYPLDQIQLPPEVAPEATEVFCQRSDPELGDATAWDAQIRIGEAWVQVPYGQHTVGAGYDVIHGGFDTVPETPGGADHRPARINLLVARSAP